MEDKQRAMPRIRVRDFGALRNMAEDTVSTEELLSTDINQLFNPSRNNEAAAVLFPPVGANESYFAMPVQQFSENDQNLLLLPSAMYSGEPQPTIVSTYSIPHSEYNASNGLISANHLYSSVETPISSSLNYSNKNILKIIKEGLPNMGKIGASASEQVLPPPVSNILPSRPAQPLNGTVTGSNNIPLYSVSKEGKQNAYVSSPMSNCNVLSNVSPVTERYVIANGGSNVITLRTILQNVEPPKTTTNCTLTGSNNIPLNRMPMQCGPKESACAIVAPYQSNTVNAEENVASDFQVDRYIITDSGSSMLRKQVNDNLQKKMQSSKKLCTIRPAVTYVKGPLSRLVDKSEIKSTVRPNVGSFRVIDSNSNSNQASIKLSTNIKKTNNNECGPSVFKTFDSWDAHFRQSLKDMSHSSVKLQTNSQKPPSSKNKVLQTNGKITIRSTASAPSKSNKESTFDYKGITLKKCFVSLKRLQLPNQQIVKDQVPSIMGAENAASVVSIQKSNNNSETVAAYNNEVEKIIPPCQADPSITNVPDNDNVNISVNVPVVKVEVGEQNAPTDIAIGSQFPPTETLSMVKHTPVSTCVKAPMTVSARPLTPPPHSSPVNTQSQCRTILLPKDIGTLPVQDSPSSFKNNLDNLTELFKKQSSFCCTKCRKNVRTTMFWVNVTSHELLCQICVARQAGMNSKSKHTITEILNDIRLIAKDLLSSDSDTEEASAQLKKVKNITREVAELDFNRRRQVCGRPSNIIKRRRINIINSDSDSDSDSQ